MGCVWKDLDYPDTPDKGQFVDVAIEGMGEEIQILTSVHATLLIHGECCSVLFRALTRMRWIMVLW